MARSQAADRVVTVAPQSGQAVSVGRGELVRVTDVEGDPPLYQSRGLPGHPNCRDNFLAAVALAGISLPVVPGPVNLFQDSGPQPDGRLVVGTAASLPGQFVSFL